MGMLTMPAMRTPHFDRLQTAGAGKVLTEQAEVSESIYDKVNHPVRVTHHTRPLRHCETDEFLQTLLLQGMKMDTRTRDKRFQRE